MTVLRGALSKFRKIGGQALKFIGLATVADKVSNADDAIADTMTIGVIALAILLLFGRR